MTHTCVNVRRWDVERYRRRTAVCCVLTIFCMRGGNYFRPTCIFLRPRYYFEIFLFLLRVCILLYRLYDFLRGRGIFLETVSPESIGPCLRWGGAKMKLYQNGVGVVWDTG